MDPSALGILCSNAMEQLAECYAECELRSVSIVIDVGLPHMLVISTHDRPYLVRAHLDEGYDSVRDEAEREEEEADG